MIAPIVLAWLGVMLIFLGASILVSDHLHALWCAHYWRSAMKPRNLDNRSWVAWVILDSEAADCHWTFFDVGSQEHCIEVAGVWLATHRRGAGAVLPKPCRPQDPAKVPVG